MEKNREVALDQALAAVLAAALELGYDTKELQVKAHALIMDHSPYRKVEHPHVTDACNEIADALAAMNKINAGEER